MIDIVIKSITFVRNFGVHSLQTAFLSSRIAGVLQLDPVEAFYSGIFHDIGMITPHNGIALDDVNYRYITDRDLTSNEIGINEHALMSSFEISKLSKLTKIFPNISSNILLHHALAKYLDSSQKSDVMANIISIADVMSLYTINNQEEMSFEDFKTSLWPTKERYFDFVYDAALATIKEDYTRWMLYDIKSGNNKERIINDFTFNEKYSFEDALETGSILSYIIDSKSSFTRDHSWRVARIASAIAKELMLDDEDFFIAGLF
ncbi:MAG TPA: phosphohydrolase, partial [Fervidobacterium sp.]|nr:phosphohydrolase [Fervidobacterium sp.]